MASPASSISVLFTATTSGYDTMIESAVGTMMIHGCLRRKELIETVFAYIKETDDPRLLVRIYANTSLHEYNAMKMLGGTLLCYSVGQRTIAGIVDGSKTVDDMTIGEVPTFLETQLYIAVSRLVPVRKIPGTGLMECAHCGQGAKMVVFEGKVTTEVPLSTHHLVCAWCGSNSYLIHDKFRGLCVDLVETARQNESVRQFFVNQPWNPNPPWMSREDLFQLLEEDRNG